MGAGQLTWSGHVDIVSISAHKLLQVAPKLNEIVHSRRDDVLLRYKFGQGRDNVVQHQLVRVGRTVWIARYFMIKDVQTGEDGGK